MTAGDLVWYRQTCYGGYGFQRRVPAVFVKATDKRVTIEVLTIEGTRQRINVLPSNVMARQPRESVEKEAAWT